MEQEPSLHQIDDYDKNLPPKKKKLLIKVLLLAVVVAGIIMALKIAFAPTDEYVGTQENPGIKSIKDVKTY